MLTRLPHHLAHTLTLVDRSGRFVTAYLSPDRGAVFREVGVATNHQGDVEWHEHARATKSLERERHIAAALEESPDQEQFVAAFLRPPFFSVDHAGDLGTLYTAVYRPETRSAEYRWPGVVWVQSFDDFSEGSRTIQLLETSAA